MKTVKKPSDFPYAGNNTSIAALEFLAPTHENDVYTRLHIFDDDEEFTAWASGKDVDYIVLSVQRHRVKQITIIQYEDDDDD